MIRWNRHLKYGVEGDLNIPVYEKLWFQEIKKKIRFKDNFMNKIEGKRGWSGFGEWGKVKVNCVIGCSNNCRYCFRKFDAEVRFKRVQDWSIMKVNKKAVLKDHPKYEDRVLFPTSHDIVPIPEIREACLIVLDKLLDAGNQILLTTKPSLKVIKEICFLFTEFKHQLEFRFTITTKDEKLLSFWEPGAPLFEERLEALKHAWKKGFETSISIEPFLDRDPIPLVKELVPWVTGTIWIGIMTRIKRQGLTPFEEPFYKQVRKNYTLRNLNLIHGRLSKK